MKENSCFLFGHAIAQPELLPRLEKAVEKHYTQYNARCFIVGCRGCFDQYATTVIKHLKEKYDDISLVMLLAYHPAERKVVLTKGFDGTFYPPLERVPRKYAIVKANQYMVTYADSIICYAKYPGNSRKMLEFAKHKHTKKHIPITNVADEDI